MVLAGYLLVMLVGWVITTVNLLINTRKVSFLSDQRPVIDESSVAIIIAVRNEAADLCRALLSVCNLNYKNCRIVVVNDRSTDGTRAILDDFMISHPALTVHEITELPPRWLGKNNALYHGYLQTTEEWLLFTDADIIFDPSALNRAMHYAQQNKLDHLTVLPQVRSRSAVLNAVLATFRMMLELKTRPWKVSDPKSSASIGIGAFNLLKRDAYEQAGTHQAIKLRPDD